MALTAASGTSPSSGDAGWRRRAGVVLLFLLVARLAAMALIPLNDTTEARYAEIARKMLETGDWVTQLHAYGVPFWGKPPLSAWLSAGAMGLFGVNELAIRLPSLLLALGMLWLVFGLARREDGPDAGRAAVLILAGGLLFYTAAGTVMTDPALVFAATLCQAAFWRAWRDGDRRWGYLFFAGLGLGLLAKGPLVGVLVGMPLVAWLALRREWRPLWTRLPWLGGTTLMLAIALPWYVLAEIRTPGFLNYFIVGEHVHRFLTPGWKGDLYGFAHATPRGVIWLYALVALLPWSPALVAWLWRRRRALRPLCRDDDGWLLYALLWCLMPGVFFTVSGNIIWPYALPMAPGFALLAAALWARGRRAGESDWLPGLAALSGIAALFTAALFVVAPGSVGYSQKRMVEAWRAQQPTADSVLLFRDSRPLFSAEFYSAGRARMSTDNGHLAALLENGTIDYVAIPEEELKDMPLRDRFEEVARLDNTQGVMLLLRERGRAANAVN